MLTVGQLGRQFDLSRSTLLYYDRIGLLSPSGRSEAGYRLYGQDDVERLRSICAYRDAGLSLEEIAAVLENLEVPQREVLERRLTEIGQNIRRLQHQQQVLAKMLKINASSGPFTATGKQLWVEMFRAAGMDESAMRRWHREFEQQAPQDHHAFLLSLGISEKEALQIRKLSANMEMNAVEMDFFYRLYEGVEKLAPSLPDSTRMALELLPELPANPRVLDIGCGCGAQTRVLAELLDGQIVAVDNHQPFLDRLIETTAALQLRAEVIPQCVSMFELPFDDSSFDLIWAEGSIYIIGFREGLSHWRPLLKPGGCLVLSELVWLQDNPPRELNDYWRENYPDMAGVEQRLAEADAAGYRVLNHFTLPGKAWREEYYRPLRKRIKELRQELGWNDVAEKVFSMTEQEANIYDRFGDWYGYEFFLLQKT